MITTPRFDIFGSQVSKSLRTASKMCSPSMCSRSTRADLETSQRLVEARADVVRTIRISGAQQLGEVSEDLFAVKPSLRIALPAVDGDRLGRQIQRLDNLVGGEEAQSAMAA